MFSLVGLEDWRPLADHTGEDIPNPGDAPYHVPAGGVASVTPTAAELETLMDEVHGPAAPAAK